MESQPPSSSRVSSESFDQHNAQLQAAALKVTRNAATLPSDIHFYRSIDPALAHDIDTISSRVLHLTNKLLELSSSADPKTAKGKGKAKKQMKKGKKGEEVIVEVSAMELKGFETTSRALLIDFKSVWLKVGVSFVIFV